MATSKDTRVRVEGFSKISINTMCSMPSGLSCAGTRLPARFMACAMSTMRRRVLASMQSISRKCRGGMTAARLSWRRPSRRLGGGLGHAPQRRRQALRGLPDLRVGDVERRQQAHDVFAGAHGQKLFAEACAHNLAHRRLHPNAGKKAAGAHLLDDVGMLILDARQLLLEAQAGRADALKEARLQHRVE